jgi:hypothetical protein
MVVQGKKPPAGGGDLLSPQCEPQVSQINYAGKS